MSLIADLFMRCNKKYFKKNLVVWIMPTYIYIVLIIILMKKQVVIVTKPNEVVVSELRISLVQMAANDISRTEMAKEKELSVRTIEQHFDRLKDIFGVKTVGALIADCFRKKLIK